MLEKLIVLNQSPIKYATRPNTDKEAGIRAKTPTKDTRPNMMDTVSLHTTTETEGPVTVSQPDAAALKLSEDTRYGILTKMVSDLLKDQGVEITIRDRDADIDIESLTPEEADKLLDDDGYFGVEQTSNRIFKLAVGIAGGDPERIDAIKAGIERGFNRALEAFGGTLPDISYDTHDAVMEKLDQWTANADVNVQ